MNKSRVSQIKSLTSLSTNQTPSNKLTQIRSSSRITCKSIVGVDFLKRWPSLPIFAKQSLASPQTKSVLILLLFIRRQMLVSMRSRLALPQSETKELSYVFTLFL